MCSPAFFLVEGDQIIMAPTDHQTSGQPRSSSGSWPSFKLRARGERVAGLRGGADDARGGGGVGRTQRMLRGDEASWRGIFKTMIRVVCDHHKMFGIDINKGRHYGVEVWISAVASSSIRVYTCARRA